MNIKKATLLGMLLAFGLSICSAFAVSVQDNVFTIAAQGVAVSFEWNGTYAITAGQPWGDSDHPDAVYINNTPIGAIIQIYCGDKVADDDYNHGTPNVIDYFNSVSPTAGNDTTGGADLVSMEFAIQGTLTINSDKYFLVVGQFDQGWVLGGQNFRYDSSRSVGEGTVITSDGKYALSQETSGSNSFIVSLNQNNAQSKTSSK